MRKYNSELNKLKEDLGVKASSKCLRLSAMINMVNLNHGKPVSKVTVMNRLKITDRTFYRYCRQIDFIEVKNGMVRLVA